jgi:hypothetical protein
MEPCPIPVRRPGFRRYIIEKAPGAAHALIDDVNSRIAGPLSLPVMVNLEKYDDKALRVVSQLLGTEAVV